MATAQNEQGVSTGQANFLEREAVAEIELANGPLNLVTRPLLRQLNQILTDISRKPHLRCVILHGGPARAFCAGSDIREFGPIRHVASEQKILFEDMVLRNLARLSIPTIAAIDGPALGGGLEIALCCDLRVLRHGVKVGLPESHLGGLAGNGAVRLTRLIGPARAKQMLFTAAPISSDQALAWGVVNEVVDGSAVDAARAMAEIIVQRGPISNRFAKELVDLAQDLPLDGALLHSTVLQQRIFDSDDLHEGAEAFFQKRSPTFSNQ